jgi:hypothetical protein
MGKASLHSVSREAQRNYLKYILVINVKPEPPGSIFLHHDVSYAIRVVFCTENVRGH